MSIQKNNHTLSEGKLKTPPLSLSSNKNSLNNQIKTSYINKKSFHMSNIRITNNFENRGTKNFSENISLQLSKPSSMPIQYFQTTNKKNIDRFIPIRNKNENYSITNNFLLNYNNKTTNLENKNNNNNNESTISLLNSFMLDALCINDNSINKTLKNRILKFNKNTNNNNINNINNNNMYFNPINQINSIINNNSNILKEIDPIIERKKNIEIFPELILDAPNFIDDYYLNLLDWGTKNIISVALSKSVYLYNYLTQQINLLFTDINNICSLNFMNNGIVLAIGLKNGNINLFDIEKNKLIRKINNVRYDNRVSVLNWNNYILSSSGKDNVIINHDVRKKNDIIQILNGHNKEVCSLKWNNNYNNYLNGDYLLSGGNDNLINLWDIKNLSKPLNTIINTFNSDNNDEIKFINPQNTFNLHKGCVKALDWCPYERNIFISGGGVNDKTLKIWNSSNGTLIKNIKVNSQICSVYFNKYEKEILTTHGFSKNEIGIWSFPKMLKITELYGHTNRVLYSCMSPDGYMLLTGSTDETLRFWKINDKNKIENNLNNNEKYNKNNIFESMNIR